MDKIDHAIIGLLQRDGRLSYRELGEQVQLSSNAAAERVKRLIASGAIRHIKASINPAAIGRMLEAQIDIKLRPDTSAAAFEKAVRGFPQVVSAMLVTGSFDYMVRVACTDRDDLVRITETLREKAGVHETYSRVILRELTVDSI
jgi:Lrp/AsnC family transcriptional regulator, leucine-responsive regulatory protein